MGLFLCAKGRKQARFLMDCGPKTDPLQFGQFALILLGIHIGLIVRIN